MMCVKVKIKPSRIQGTGVFADEDIPKGTVVWKFQPGFDVSYSLDELKRLPDNARTYLATYAYLSRSSGRYVFCVDEGKYFNHSERANTHSDYSASDTDEGSVTRASRDIRRGEELTSDYRDFDGHARGNAGPLFPSRSPLARAKRILKRLLNRS